jgi:hypothetical protein
MSSFLINSSNSQVKRFSKKLFFEEDDIESSLSRLEELTEEESSMVLAELAASRSGK